MNDASDPSGPSFGELLRAFIRIGLLSFGGPAGQIALMHQILVDERKWVSEDDYLRALNLCHLLPGPEAQQLATWVGWRLHGVKGGLAAGLLFVIPGALVILALSMLYAVAARLTLVEALFTGIKAAVLAIVLQALIRIAGRALQTPFKKGLAAAAFIALFFLQLPFPVVILAAGIAGAIVAQYRPEWLALKPHGASLVGARPWAATAKTVAVWLLIWALPLVLIAGVLGRDTVFWDIGVYFSKLAMVTFGGAYAVLAYMAQSAVQDFGWLTAGEMADGLGLAETTPGPLIMVTQFVGFLAAFRAPEPFTPLMAGLIGAGITTWVTFAPCFLWIFALAPWMERLSGAARLQGSLAAITASVVGVIANLSLWFALHVIFARVSDMQLGPFSLQWPDLASINWITFALAAFAGWLVFGQKWSPLKTLGACAAIALIVAVYSAA
jgi:chromate transporter